MELSRVNQRDGLKPQREPYWHRLAVGQFIGFRPSTISKVGSWVVRLYDPDTRRNKFRSLGDFGSLPLNERFTAARKSAAEWFEHVGAGGSTKPVPVREACERYAEGRPEAVRRFQQYIYNDPIAKLTLDKLKKQHVLAFRKRLESKPALVSRRKHGELVTRPRSPATVNRDMVPLRAALNNAKDIGLVTTDAAWASDLRPNKGADRRRNLYLDRGERRALIKNLPTDCAAFVRGLSLLPLRPGALAALKVGDFDLRRNELVISHDKAGHARKILGSYAEA